MEKLSKKLMFVYILSTLFSVFSSPIFAKKAVFSTNDQVKAYLWHVGVDSQHIENVGENLDVEEEQAHDILPEELERALMVQAEKDGFLGAYN